MILKNPRALAGLVATAVVGVLSFSLPATFAAAEPAYATEPYLPADKGSYMIGLKLTDAARLGCDTDRWGLVLRPSKEPLPNFEDKNTVPPAEVGLAWSAITPSVANGEKIVFANSSRNAERVDYLENLGVTTGDYALGAVCVASADPAKGIGAIQVADGHVVGEWRRVSITVNEPNNADKNSFSFVDGDAFDAPHNDFPWWGVAGIAVVIAAAGGGAWWYASKRRRV